MKLRSLHEKPATKKSIPRGTSWTPPDFTSQARRRPICVQSLKRWRMSKFPNKKPCFASSNSQEKTWSKPRFEPLGRASPKAEVRCFSAMPGESVPEQSVPRRTTPPAPLKKRAIRSASSGLAARSFPAMCLDIAAKVRGASCRRAPRSRNRCSNASRWARRKPPVSLGASTLPSDAQSLHGFFRDANAERVRTSRTTSAGFSARTTHSTAPEPSPLKSGAAEATNGPDPPRAVAKTTPSATNSHRPLLWRTSMGRPRLAKALQHLA
mmetsp:Transcript_112486/g.314320  ORF Transcript_112486/g.314320 Transcript_112486/m.314320 type:complete len:267 (+) Transcript_112486:1151-1951(+)